MQGLPPEEPSEEEESEDEGDEDLDRPAQPQGALKKLKTDLS